MKLPLNLFLLFACGLFCLPSIAQTGFREGYVVSGGDTLRGRIDCRDWVATPHRIHFMDARTGKETVYGADEISAFFANEDLYRSWKIRLYPYSQDPAVVTRPGWNGNPYDTTLFLRLVTAGGLDLYSWQDATDVTYFFVGVASGQPQQLRIVNRVVKKGTATDVITDDLYKYQLADLVAGCPMIAGRPVEVAYEENALSRLISTYNHCGKELAGNGKGRYHWKAQLVPMAGYLHGSVKMSGNADAVYAGWPAFNAPTGGLGLFLQPTRGRRKLGIQLDVLYDHFSLNSGKFQKNYYQSYTGHLDYDELKGNIQLRYQQPVGIARPFIAIGFSNTMIINNKSRQSLYDAGTSQNIRQPLFGSEEGIRMYRPGAFVSLGTEMRHWVLEGRAEQTQGLTSLPGVNAPVTNFYVLIGYKL